MLKNKEILLFGMISIILTIVYCRFIFNPSGMVGGLYFVHDIAKTDNYQTVATIVTNMQLLQAGHIPFGTFWLPNYYGGTIATFLAVSFMPNIGGTFLLLTSLITNNIFFSFEVLVFALLLASQFFAYKLAKFQFHNKTVAWIFSIAYAFSTFLFTHINNGVLDFVAAAALIPFALLMCEKLFVSPTRKNMVSAVIALVLLFFCDLQLTIFAIYFLFLRTLYHVFSSHDKEKNLTLIKRLMEGVALFALTVAPFIISFSLIQNVGALAVPTIPSYYLVSPSLFFIRTVNITLHETASYYMGIIILALAILPIIFYRRLGKSNDRNFLFYILTVVFFLLIAIGTPLSTLVTSLFVRVPSRVQILISLSLAMCAGYGLLTLNELLKQKLPKTHLINKSKTLRLAIAIFFAVTILVDLTSGLTLVPVNNSVPKFTGGDYYVKNQQGDFRILEFPTVWGYTDYESQVLQHEIIGIGIIALRAYPPSSQVFSDLESKFEFIQQNDSNIDPGNFTLLATVCGTKYVLIQTTHPEAIRFSSFFDNSAQYFAKVYSDNESVVYENRYFIGTTFALKDNGETPELRNLTIDQFENLIIPQAEISSTESFNKLDVSANVSEPAYVVLSQSYYPYWVINNSSNTPAFTKYLGVSALHVDSGATKETLVFSVADETWKLYSGFFTPLTLAGIVIYASSKSKKKVFNLALSALLTYGVILTGLSFIGTGIAALSLRDLTNFGVFNKVLLGLGCLITVGSLVVFARKKLLDLVQKSLQIAKGLLQRGFAVKQRSNSLVANLKNKFAVKEKPYDYLIKMLLISLLFIVILANVRLFGDITSWLNDSAIGVITIAVLLFAFRVRFIENKSSILTSPSSILSSNSESKQNARIKHLHFGIFGGFLGICAAGLLMRLLTSYTHSVYFSALILCGALGGIGFGALTSGFNKLRGIITFIFGIAAILLGLIMTYSTPIITGYMLPTSTQAAVPIYKWHEYTFIQFAGLQLLTVHGVFYMLFGLAAAYFAGTCISLRTKQKKIKLKLK
jgi:hypothetical protein